MFYYSAIPSVMCPFVTMRCSKKCAKYSIKIWAIGSSQLQTLIIFLATSIFSWNITNKEYSRSNLPCRRYKFHVLLTSIACGTVTSKATRGVDTRPAILTCLCLTLIYIAVSCHTSVSYGALTLLSYNISIYDNCHMRHSTVTCVIQLSHVKYYTN